MRVEWPCWEPVGCSQPQLTVVLQVQPRLAAEAVDGRRGSSIPWPLRLQRFSRQNLSCWPKQKLAGRSFCYSAFLLASVIYLPGAHRSVWAKEKKVVFLPWEQDGFFFSHRRSV